MDGAIPSVPGPPDWKTTPTIWAHEWGCEIWLNSEVDVSQSQSDDVKLAKGQALALHDGDY